MTKNRMSSGIVALCLIFGACGNADAGAKKKAAIGQKQAVAIVEKRAEVKAWKKEVAAAAKTRGVSAVVEFDRKENGEYIVHVYEVVPDDKETSHTATFNWYHVNEKTGKVSKEF